MNKYTSIVVFVFLLAVTACNDAWENHTKLNDDVLQESIGNYLETTPDFSSFYALLKSTGYDEQLKQSGVFTVWAPTNQAMSELDNNFINTDEKKKLFVLNHIVYGTFSMNYDKNIERITMNSGKVLVYDPQSKLIDNISVQDSKEKTLGNGMVQVVAKSLVPRYNVWEYIELEAPRNKFVTYMNSITKTVFDDINSKQIGVDSRNRPIYDTIWVKQNPFLMTIANLTAEDSIVTFLIPSDEVYNEQFDRFQKYFRKEDKGSNEIPTTKDSAYISLMIARDFLFDGIYTKESAPDTLVSYYGVKVPFAKNAVTNSVQVSNGMVHFINQCDITKENKILPILMEAENSVYSTAVTSGTPNAFYRIRPDASNGYDFILDNAHTSQVLSGALFRGPVVSSIKYRIKIRAINDFNKSYRNPNSTVELRQMLGTVTITRNPVTDEIINISPVANKLNSGALYGIPDVTYDPNDPNSYYVPIVRTVYSPIANANDDELDLGYYDFSKADNVFLRLIPLSAGMAVMADYFRLVPIIE